jgi:hypothetical protein
MLGHKVPLVVIEQIGENHEKDLVEAGQARRNGRWNDDNLHRHDTSFSSGRIGIDRNCQ